MSRYVLIAGAIVLGGCAHEYVYRPAEHATASIHGRVAADYEIPAQAPQGDVRIASFGISRISPTTAPDEVERAVHLRMIVANNSAETWTIDTRQVRVDFPGIGQTPPAFVSTRDGESGLPIVNVSPRGQRVLDMFYPLPATMQSASRIPQFDVVWQVRTATQLVAERTPFDRLRVEPAYAAGYGPEWAWYGGWGGPFWYDPWYPAAVLGPQFTTGPVMIGAPTWHGEEEAHEHGRR